MNPRLVIGALIGVGGVVGVAFAALHAVAPLPGSGSFAVPVKDPAAPLTGSADARQLSVGSATSWPTVTYQDTGAADWSKNPAGWDYAVIGVRNGR